MDRKNGNLCMFVLCKITHILGSAFGNNVVFTEYPSPV